MFKIGDEVEAVSKNKEDWDGCRFRVEQIIKESWTSAPFYKGKVTFLTERRLRRWEIGRTWQLSQNDLKIFKKQPIKIKDLLT